ncbi:BZIP family transcription factor [Sarocladium implicatum]|nr:BZIP family transcription factor [Sarocladium implicatum]
MISGGEPWPGSAAPPSLTRVRSAPSTFGTYPHDPAHVELKLNASVSVPGLISTSTMGSSSPPLILTPRSEGPACEGPIAKRAKSIKPRITNDEPNVHNGRRNRGRPRLGLDPATAADVSRRRAQLRVAQRAYRDRKENTLSSLEKKLQDLEKSEKTMQRDLAGFYEAFVAQGLANLAPDLTIRLKSMLDQRPARDDGNKTSESRDSSSSAPIHQDPVTAELLQKVQHQTDLTRSPRVEMVTGKSSTDSSEYAPQSNTSSESSAPTPPFDNSDCFIRFSTHSMIFIDCVGWTSSLAWMERTFGRRMQRTALEAAHELVHLPAPNPDHLNAIFGFCCLWETFDMIRHRMLRLISRSAYETLDDWDFPFATLGSAGQFSATTPLNQVPGGMPGEPDYLPIGNYGTYRTPEDRVTMSTEPFMGPFGPNVENTRDSYLDQQMHIIFPNFDGHFFDYNDTELYLRLRGIVIPAMVDYVTAVIDLDDFLPNASEQRNTGKPTPSPCRTRWEQLQRSATTASTNIESLLPTAFMTRADWNLNDGSSHMFPASAPLPNPSAQFAAGNGRSIPERRIKVSIDVNRLVSGELPENEPCSLLHY